jgi:uncharacterized protein YjbJ (UPF0337 family)
MKDRIKGKGSELGGRAKEAVGRVTGDRDLQAEGTVDRAKGKGQQAWDKVKGTARDVKEDVKEIVRDRDREHDRLDRDIDKAA